VSFAEKINLAPYFLLATRVKDGGLAELAWGNEGSDGRQPDLVGWKTSVV